MAYHCPHFVKIVLWTKCRKHGNDLLPGETFTAMKHVMHGEKNPMSVEKEEI